MKVKIPKYIIVNGQKHQLYVEYRKSTTPDETEWVWRVTYVSDHGILYNRSNKSMGDIENDVFQFIKQNNYDYE